MEIDFDSAQPIYEQIIEEIKRMIVRGEMEPGDKLPSQRDMAKKVGVNPNTIQRAYREMENRDLVITKRGRGTFISNSEEIIIEIRNEMAQQATINFLEEMISLGFGFKGIKDKLERNFKYISAEDN